MNTLKRLQNWFHDHCNGDWEHDEGITIKTLDNPGWVADIHICGTELENKVFEKVKIDRGTNDWLYCFIEDGQFKIRCGSHNLEEGIDVFLRWANPELDRPTMELQVPG